MNTIRNALAALVVTLVACGDTHEHAAEVEVGVDVAPDAADSNAPDTTAPDTIEIDTAAPDVADTTEPDVADTTETDVADATEPEVADADVVDSAEPEVSDDVGDGDDGDGEVALEVISQCVCDDPPPTDVAAACAAGTTVDVYLGAGCGGTCDDTGACVYTPTTYDCPPPEARLAQTQGWQVALRTGLASMSEGDYNIELAPTRFDAAMLDDPEETFRLWVASERLWYTAPASDGLRLPAATFLIDHIEKPDGVRGGASTTEINGMIFWHRWDWAGNPYRGLRSAALRAFAMSAVDLIMIDTVHAPGTLYAQQHFLAGTMNWMSGAFLDASPHLDRCTAAAYRLGLQTMFARLEQWDSNNGNNDMAQPGHIALYEAALAMPDPSWMARAEAESKEIFDASGYWHEEAGYFDHGVALDTSYEGITTHMLSAAALGIPWPHLRHAIDKYSRLKAHMILPEPDGVGFNSPSHWSPATAAGVSEDQWWSYHREVGAAMLSDEALYLLSGGRRVNVDFHPLDLETMRADVNARMPTLDTRLSTPIEGYEPALWAPRHWSTGRMASVLNYAPGFYAHLTDLAAQDSPLLRPPVARGENFVENFGDDFVIVRFADYAAIVYAGPIADEWAAPLSGFGGGALSAFWTQAGGSFVLGMTHGSQNPNHDTWDELAIWATQHLYGTTEAGAHFTTALVQRPARTITNDATQATIDVAAAIGPEAWSAPDALGAEPSYARKISLDAAGVSLTTTLDMLGHDPICELIDVVPLYLHDAYQLAPLPEPIVAFIDSNGERMPASDVWTNAVAVEVQRFSGTAVLTLDHERRVRLAPAVWTNAYQVYPSVRSLHIDALGSDACVAFPPSTTIGWTLSAGAPMP